MAIYKYRLKDGEKKEANLPDLSGAAELTPELELSLSVWLEAIRLESLSSSSSSEP